MDTDQTSQPLVMPYDMPKPQGEPDLIIEVGQLLIDNGLKDKVELYYTTSPLIRSALGRNMPAQIYVLNKYWHDQFLIFESSKNFQESTLNVRQHLINNADYAMWINHFKKFVMPYVLTHNLPGVYFQ